jgi:hypothetical protein
MTPFIDAGGFRWLQRVFEATRTDCQKIVVVGDPAFVHHRRSLIPTTP